MSIFRKTDAQVESHTEQVSPVCKTLQRASAVCFHAGYGATIAKLMNPCELTFLGLVLTDRDEPMVEVADVLEISLR